MNDKWNTQVCVLIFHNIGNLFKLVLILFVFVSRFPDDTEEDNRNEEEVPLEINNNNLNNNNNVNNVQNTQSRLIDNQLEFRADKESSFFPYFMFLMFVVVTFYVAYHNKSKILALLIEGRRSRSYSSRGGSGRRKQHSAEYRKLDSNLEEAIQSDGGHVLSTQIIY